MELWFFLLLFTIAVSCFALGFIRKSFVSAAFGCIVLIVLGSTVYAQGIDVRTKTLVNRDDDGRISNFEEVVDYNQTVTIDNSAPLRYFSQMSIYLGVLLFFSALGLFVFTRNRGS